MIRVAGPRRAVAVAVLALVALAGAALAAPKFPPLTGRVVDNANLLSPQAEQKLTDELAALEQKTGHQVVVATIPDLQGYPIEDYGYQLGRTWKIGDEKRDDGVVFLVAPNERKVRIEVGYGLEPVLTDALSSTIIQAKVLPAFRSGNLEKGVVDGAEAVIQQLSLPEDQARALAAQPAEVAPAPASSGHIPSFLVLIFVIWIIFSVLRGLGGRRSGGLWWLPFLLLNSGGRRDGWGGGGGGGWGGGGGGGGFSGGGGSFGGGGSSGSW
jgi:uncharacterized protein